MTSSKISVIVPVYNTEKWLRRCVDSILAQTYTDFELLLIDDGSTDGSGAICDEYAKLDPRVRVFHKPNGGVSSARNLGLDHAQGEWITFADSDDYVYPCWIENFNLIENDKYDLLCQSFDSMNPSFGLSKNNNKIKIDIDGCINEYILNCYRENSVGYLFVRAFRRSIIELYQIRFDSKVNLREDELFSFNYFNHIASVKSTHNIGYHYCNSIQSNKYKFSLIERELVDLPIIKILDDLGFTEDDDIFNHYCDDLVGAYYLEINNSIQNGIDCIAEIKGLQEILKYNYKKTRIFKLTKLLLKHDRHCIISNIFFRIYFKIRPI